MRQIKVDVTARTKDGLPVNITCAFQYQLVDSLESILNLYNKWGTKGYEKAFLRMAKGVLREAVSSFSGMSVVTERTAVEEVMRGKLAAMLDTSHAILRNFQLFRITLPEEFMKSIYELENSNQEYTTILYELESAKTYAEGVIAKADEEMDTIISEAEGYARRLGYVRMECD